MQRSLYVVHFIFKQEIMVLQSVTLADNFYAFTQCAEVLNNVCKLQNPNNLIDFLMSCELILLIH